MVKRRMRAVAPVAVAVAAVVLASVAMHAQQTDRARALDEQIGRIFQAREYEVPRFGPARWLPDGVSYSTIEPSTALAGSADIVTVTSIKSAEK